MSELATTIREALAALAGSDRSRKRFGAAAHRYELAAPASELPPLDLPEDLHEFVARIGASGAGPGYGFLGIAHGAVRANAPWQVGVAVADLGCGYAAVVSLDRASFGQVWFDGRAAGVVKPIAPTFTAWYLEWIDRLARNLLPDAVVPPGVCPLPNALSGYLGMREQQLGLDPGALSGAQLREALDDLGPHSIEIAAESSVLYPDGTRVDPCVACARLIENLGADGLRADVVKPSGDRPGCGRSSTRDLAVTGLSE